MVERALETWSPQTHHVQGGLPPGNFLSAKFCLICAGPPMFSQLALDSDGAASVYPIGLAQNFSHSSNKSVNKLFEVGSGRSYWMFGHSVAQLSLGRVMYHGPSLLRCLWAYYDTTGSSFEKIKPLTEIGGGCSPFAASGSTAGTAARSAGLHDVRIPPGYDNLFINLASDLFSQPTGMLLIMKDNQENTVGSFYLEQCVVPNHSFAFDAQSLVVQESCSIMYERMLPLKISQLELVSGLLDDETGGYPQFG